ncbi:hypothetical protein DFJ73DRAFT_844883 [Zopfochytrium polystomum]|nr:hypothetical protein DFJ73DRAFT_844883 [Zopfochytrium polystomum]
MKRTAKSTMASSLPAPNALGVLCAAVESSTHGLIPAAASYLAVRLALGIVWRTLFFLGITEFQFRVLGWMYRRGILSRYQAEVPTQRNIGEYLIGQIGVTIPLALYIVPRTESIMQKTVFQLDLVDILKWHVFMFALVDTWYYFGHRLMHKNKFLYNRIHHKHHLQKNVSSWSTANADFLENLFLVAPPLTIFVATMDLLSPKFNQLTFLLCTISQTSIFVLGHSGYKQHPAMWLVCSPTSTLINVAHAFGVGLNTQDHEMHHLYPLCNYSLNFSFWDRLFGTYKDIEHLDAFKRGGAAQSADAKKAN